MKRYTIIGKCLLQNILIDKHKSQVELSIVTGISTSTISQYIHNERVMSLRNARRIAFALKCHIDDLYDWKV